jgi:predicted nucleotidyltransferase component of viral defense system
MLPASQRALWHRMGPTPKDFVLYGGTALALRLAHRESIDFDFFSNRPFRALELLASIAYLEGERITQQAENTLSCEVGAGNEVVKTSFFGGLSLGQIEVPDRVETNGVAVASLTDIFAMKCATIPQRAETKDYLDIHALITLGKIDLARGLASARAIYGRQYNPVMTLQALSYFDDLTDPLPDKVRSELTEAVKSVSLQDLPQMTALRKIGESF